MRRLLSITLLLLFALPLVVAFAGEDAQSRLPICCRRGGAHHCSMGMAEGSSGDKVGTKCPSFPHAPALVSHAQDWLFDVPNLELNKIVAHGSLLVRLQAHAQDVFGGSGWTRGPPLSSLLQFGAICLLAGCCLAVRGGEALRTVRCT